MNIAPFLKNIEQDEQRNANFLHLTANENQVSNTARKFLGSKLGERYYFGGGTDDVVEEGTFYGLGVKSVEDLVNEAIKAAKEMLFASEVNLSVLSGVHAMMCAILSTTEPGEMVLTVPKSAGGHFATEGILDRVGRKHDFVVYDLPNLKFDVEKTAQKVKELNAKAIYLDVSYYLNPHNLKELRQAIGEEVIIIYDASHTMGLIMGQQFQAPLKEGANVVCANTHKTLPGPHKGMIAFRDAELGKKANDIINSSLFSTPHITHLIALSITILELKEFGQEYAKQIISNSNAIAKAFVELGYEVRKSNTGAYSHNHQAHVFLKETPPVLEQYKNLLKNNISTNFDAPLGDRFFIRIGTAELTRRGMKEKDMKTIAILMHNALNGENVKGEVLKFNKKFKKIHYSFDK